MAETALHHHCVDGFTQTQLHHDQPKFSFTSFGPTFHMAQSRTEAAETKAPPSSGQPKTEAMEHGQHERMYQAMPQEPVSTLGMIVFGSHDTAVPGYTPSSTSRQSRDGLPSWSSGHVHHPTIASNTEYHGFTTGDGNYHREISDQGLTMKGPMQGYSMTSWPPNMEFLGRNQGIMNGSDASTDISPQSPTSLWSEFSDKSSTGIQSSPGSSWMDSETGHYSRTPSFESMPYVGVNSGSARLNQARVNTAFDFSGLPPLGPGTSVPRFEQSRGEVVPETSYPADLFAWNQREWTARSQGQAMTSHTPYPTDPRIATSAPSFAPWMSGANIPQQRSFGFSKFEDVQNHNVSQDGGATSGTYTEDAHNGRVEQVAVNNAMVVRSTLDTDVRVSSPTIGRRREEDQVLLEGKRVGLTYKEIRNILDCKVAESTLRGRYRSLTKPRKDRVRKPVWTPHDIRLLKDIVRSELGRLDDASYRNLSKAQRLAKLSWKRVADYIAEKGGSYHFGNSTCKKKWAEIDKSVHNSDSDTS